MPNTGTPTLARSSGNPGSPKAETMIAPTFGSRAASTPILTTPGSASARSFGVVSSGEVQVEVRQRYKLADIAQAHRDLEGRKTSGSTIIVP